jgi:undecaprenyl diphosphate synthase
LSSDRKPHSGKFGLVPEGLPRHVAIIMDGNGRWAKKRLMNRVKGHERGTETVRMVVRATRDLGIPALTLYAFSTENWQRPKTEVAALMALLVRFLENEKAEMLENNIRLQTIGQTARLPQNVREALGATMGATAGNTGMVLNLALSYGGREEILMACRRLAEEALAGQISPEDITEDIFAGRLYTAGLPDPDIMIRTSGEMRVSNFLPWQLAYSEFFITPTLWPDFTQEEYIGILRDFQRRERRFGKTGDQTRE